MLISKWNTLYNHIQDFHFPNSAFSDEFYTFFIESKMDFHQALIQRQSVELIELRHNFTMDYSFRSLISVVPAYLSKRILDVHGHLIDPRLGTSVTGGPKSRSASASEKT
jgi:hypothetical protein